MRTLCRKFITKSLTIQLRIPSELQIIQTLLSISRALTNPPQSNLKSRTRDSGLEPEVRHEGVVITNLKWAERSLQAVISPEVLLPADSLDQGRYNFPMSQGQNAVSNNFDGEAGQSSFFSPQWYSTYIDIYSQNMKRDLNMLKNYR